MTLLSLSAIGMPVTDKSPGNRRLLTTSAAGGSGYTIEKYGIITKTFLVMKLTTIFLLAAVLQVSAKGRAQTVTLEAKQQPLTAVFAEIKKQTGYIFFYREADIANSKPVTVSLAGADVKTSLETILKGQPLLFTIKKNTVVISRKSGGDLNQRLNIDSPPITGVVTNSDGQPLAGASVKIKGTNTGAITDSDGKFTLDATPGQTLIISYVGYSNLQTVAKEENNVIKLTPTNSPLDEVVFKGYYNESKRLTTGSVGKINAQTIEKQPVANPLQALQGRLAGVVITQKTGAPGGGFDIQIRGQNSLRNSINDNGNLPLYVVDGVPFSSATLSDNRSAGSIVSQASPLAAINPSDIESIEILKDADATAIYGSRGSNGVVLITTKKGKAGSTKVDFNFYTGAGWITRKMKLLNTQQYLQMRREAYENDGGTIPPTNIDLMTWDTTRYTDWQNEMIGGTAKVTNAQATIHGGNPQTQFLLGGGYYNETTVFPGTHYDRKASLHFNGSHFSDNEKFRASISANYVADDNNLMPVDLTSLAVNLLPNGPGVYAADGKLNWEPNSWDIWFSGNPYAEVIRKYNSITNNLIGNVVLSYELIPGLQVKVNGGYNNIGMKQIATTPIATVNPIFTNATGSAVFSNSSLTTWILEPQVQYQSAIGKGKINFIAGTSFQQSIKEDESLVGSGYTSDALIENIKAAPYLIVNFSNYTRYRYNAFFGRIGYNLSDKYLINFTGRRDGSTRFGTGRQYSNFGAIGAAWIFSNEKFVAGGSVLSFGKLRASYGTTGNDQIGDYQFLDTYVSTTGYSGNSGLIPERLANPDFSWEKTSKLEAAVDLGFFNDRLFLSINWYRNRSSNQLVGYPLSVVSGFPTIQSNFPATVQNTGLEFQLNIAPVNNSTMVWKTALNLTLPRNELVSFPNIESSSFNDKYVVGHPLTIRKGYQYLGVDAQTGIYNFTDFDNSGGTNFPGDYQTVIDMSQKYYGGFQNIITFRQIELDFLLQFIKQNGLNYRAFYPVPGGQNNQPTEVLQRWRKPGDISDVQAFTRGFDAGGEAYNNLQNSSGVVSDASFVRLKNVSLSYRFDKKTIKKLKMTEARIFVQGQNVFTITNYLGMDPENQSLTSLPPLRMITAGVQITL